MRTVVCEFANCQTMIESGEGITVSYGGYRKRFCCHFHAAWALEKWALRLGRLSVITEEEFQRLVAADPGRRQLLLNELRREKEGQ